MNSRLTRIPFVLLLWLLLASSSTSITRKFPSFELRDSNGHIHSEKLFQNKRTLVVLNYLGCYHAMKLMKDLDSLALTIDTSKYQIIVMLENSENQIKEFYSSKQNGPSDLRKDFKIDASDYLILAQCRIRKLHRSTKKVTSCNPISRKLFTAASPTSYLVDERGKIRKKSKGYVSLSPIDERMKWLNDFIKD
jgi:peroxiredoxin